MERFSRRFFINFSTVLSAAARFLPLKTFFSDRDGGIFAGKGVGPAVISTWRHGLAANRAAWRILSRGGTALDAVEAGVRVTEDDPEVTSVGYGGYPDEKGLVTLDASIMGPDGNCGSVAFVQGYRHPVSIARKVMEETDHEMLVGAGAEEFARRHGFKEERLLTGKARQGWLKWKAGKSGKDDFLPSRENHDTVGMVSRDAAGNLAAACTTSGRAFKIHGRVGDSPLIGAGIYVDNEVGAAAATGEGEMIIKACGSFLAVEYMRRGVSPRKACRKVLERIIEREGEKTDLQVGLVALSRSGETGAYSLCEGFEYALARDGGNELRQAEYIIKCESKRRS
ncbi:MAG: N(4)-(beta-N-acetylglucosaminyl)-L-asparaginase [Candidatus Krumholzibacteriota bacterium]|nr:N(4)-(beta-N-acetylglucosaminyl)-L-asparaginase [Candidatus Krumholzibacteriota bacterium]